MKNRTTLGKLAILLATLFWGTSFVIIKDAVDLIPPNYLLALRFTSAGILLTAIFWKRFRGIQWKTIRQGVLIGVFLYLAYLFQTYGIMDTTPGKNAFLTAFYCVLVPFLAWICRDARPDRWNVLAAVLCVAGIGFICLNGDLSVRKGDILTIIGGFFFACHMVAISKFGSKNDPVVITVLQFASAAVCFWVTSLITEGVPAAVSVDVWPAVIYLSLFCTAATLLLQNFGQKYTPPSVAALLLSLESVFGTIISFALGRDRFSAPMVFGFLLVFLAIVISETKLSFLKKGEKAVDSAPKA